VQGRKLLYIKVSTQQAELFGESDRILSKVLDGNKSSFLAE